MLRVGFLGLGVMGAPMALNVARTFPLTVWNRSSSKYPPLIQAGANTGSSPSHVIRHSDIIFMMLFDEHAIRAVLTDDVRHEIRSKTLVNSSSVSVEFSHYLSEQVRNAGGEFIEMPVSGSTIPAEQGRLVAMMAGDRTVADRIKPFVEPMTSAAVYCGPIGSGLKMKYAINTLLIAMTAGLAEAMNLARAQGLDLNAFGQVLDARPLASAYSRIKVAKMLNQDWSAQAAIRDCYNSTQLILAAAREANTRSPLMQLCSSLYRHAIESGLGDEDMTSLVKCLPGPNGFQDRLGSSEVRHPQGNRDRGE
ncbi:NAD(P)-binding protein [Parathielavia appendiculata]|uniref:NAD(P)-binding protein n=1 Tax=Parathielavia appendiculata TaxID=2587402 RepID=A0AAN6TW11_9PEZI|nr:NAD(P)-binding protein [Parathielavia appendiculata]